MKKRLINFEDYLSNVYRQANGKKLKKVTVRDYLFYCKESGRLLKHGENGLYKIDSPELVQAYLSPVEFLFASKYENPDTALNGFKAYIGFLQHQNSTC